MKRRDVLKAGLITPALLGAGAAAQIAPTRPQPVGGWEIVPPADADPLDAKIVAFTIVTPDLAASLHFYRDLLGYAIVEQGRLDRGLSTAPGAATLGRRYALLAAVGGQRGGPVRLVEAPAGAAANRRRPQARTFDPGLAIMECQTPDPAESYRVLKNAGVPMISSPRYYFFRETGMGRDLDVMSYAPFGPAGEQMFITANVRSDRPKWPIEGLHGNFSGVVILSLDQRPVEAFYRSALGLRRVNQMDSFQRNTNELMGGPPDNYFVWGFLGRDVRIELEEHRQPQGVVYPTSLDRTGLAMMTIAVNDLGRAREMCRAASIEPVGQGALPLVSRARPEGFTLRGAVGELIEVVGRA